ncbi:MAG: translation elongation factor Ts [Actinobacteria bacterium]|nr:translation elongation factor Ts [Actinomycetota bacterium]
MSENRPHITAAQVKVLREATGAGMMDCKRALEEAEGDVARATEILRERGLASARKKAGRAANEGLVASYIHHNSRVGVLVEVNCETDFVANTEEFRTLAREVALHVASMSPRWTSRDEVPTAVLEAESRIYEARAREMGRPEKVVPRVVEGMIESFYRDNVLLDQPYVRDDSRTIGQLVDEASARLGEKVAVRRFTRYQLGEELEEGLGEGLGEGPAEAPEGGDRP